MDSLTCDEEVDDAAADGAGADLALVQAAVPRPHRQDLQVTAPIRNRYDTSSEPGAGSPGTAACVSPGTSCRWCRCTFTPQSVSVRQNNYSVTKTGCSNTHYRRRAERTVMKVFCQRWLGEPATRTLEFLQNILYFIKTIKFIVCKKMNNILRLNLYCLFFRQRNVCRIAF